MFQKGAPLTSEGRHQWQSYVFFWTLPELGTGGGVLTLLVFFALS